MDAVLFFIAGIGALAGAIGVITVRNPFFAVLSLVCHLFALAVLFLLLSAQFVAAAQIVVYAGAVMVLYVFVVAYIGGGAEPVRAPSARTTTALAALAGAGLFVVLIIATLGSGLQALDSHGAGVAASFGSPAEIGRLLLTKFLFPFEVASFLLLVAAVAAVVLARRRGVPHPGEEQAISVADVLRVPPGTGSMREALGQPTGTNPGQQDDRLVLPVGEDR
jgi:NADH-quinone oxidoreductase subunit J